MDSGGTEVEVPLEEGTLDPLGTLESVLRGALEGALEGELGEGDESSPPLGPPAGTVEPLVLAASSLKASRVFGPYAGGLMTATMPAAQ